MSKTKNLGDESHFCLKYTLVGVFNFARESRSLVRKVGAAKKKCASHLESYKVPKPAHSVVKIFVSFRLFLLVFISNVNDCFY